MENSREGTKEKISYDEDKEIDKNQLIERLKMILTSKGELDEYQIFS